MSPRGHDDGTTQSVRLYPLAFSGSLSSTSLSVYPLRRYSRIHELGNQAENQPLELPLVPSIYCLIRGLICGVANKPRF